VLWGGVLAAFGQYPFASVSIPHESCRRYEMEKTPAKIAHNAQFRDLTEQPQTVEKVMNPPFIQKLLNKH
jgi:hypothetical protein